jgi:uncharacterized protein (DUF2252 family)
MERGPGRSRVTCRLIAATVCVLLIARASERDRLRPLLTSLTGASAELADRLGTDPFAYFRFANRAWASRVCEAFSDVSNLPVVRLHGDAHVEQFAVTRDGWGVVDFDDSTRGPQYLDIVRFLGSVDLATRQRGWRSDRDVVWDRFFEGYRAGLSDPTYRPPQPPIVDMIRGKAQLTRAAFLAWGQEQMQPMDDAMSTAIVAGMKTFEQFVRRNRHDLPPGYFTVKAAGWLRMGVGSYLTRKVLIRVQGPTTDDEDDELVEVKEVTNLDGVRCIEGPTSPPALRVVEGARQISRLKHNILAVGPALVIPAAGNRVERWLDWWVSSWEPSYRELRLGDLRSVDDLGDIAYDSAVQLGASEANDAATRAHARASVARLEDRLRREASIMVEELLAGWRQQAVR